jgi:hypothetical protein
MQFSVSKVVSNVDCGVLGKKTLSIEANISEKKDGDFAIDCFYVYIINDKGHKVPMQEGVYDRSLVLEKVNECVAKIKNITTIGFVR